MGTSSLGPSALIRPSVMMSTAFSTGLNSGPTKAVAPVMTVVESDIVIEGSPLQAANASRQKEATTVAGRFMGLIL